MPTGPDCAFYVVADHRHFLGAVALVNSLRLLGHAEPVRLVDAGLTDRQRALLAGQVELLLAPPEVPPVHLAPYGPLARPAAVQVVLDADIIATRPLGELLDAGRRGMLVGFINDPPNHDRFFPEWAPALGLPAVHQRPYLNAGQFVLPAAMNDRLLGAWIDGQERVGMLGTRYGRARLSDPFYFADQDVVNAVLAARVDDAELDVRPHRLAPHPPFRDLRLLDARRLDCRYPDGARPYFLHHTMGKPWLQPTRRTVYSALLPRLLLAADLPIRLAPDDVPVRVRDGVLAELERRRGDLQTRAVSGTRRQLGRFGIRTRLAERGRRRSGASSR